MSVVAMVALQQDKPVGTWATQQKVMSSPERMCQTLANIDYKALPAKQQQAIIKAAKSPSCDPDIMMKKSNACAGFAKYI